MNAICFRLDCNSLIGGGHLRRCLNLSKMINQRIKFIFLIEIAHEDKINVQKQLIYKVNYQYFFVEKFAPDKEKDFLLNIKNKYKKLLFFFDISNINKLKEIKKIQYFFKKIQSIEKKIIIDSVKKEALLPHIKKLKLGIVVTPYENAKRYFGPFKHFVGRKYFFYDPKLRLRKKKIRNKIKNILISFGNSDKKKISLFCVRSLYEILPKYNTKIVVGPMFDKDQIDKLKIISKKNKKLKLIFNKDHLSNLYNWCDILISSCGNTKFEFMIYKKPLIIIPHSILSESQLIQLKKEKICLITKSINKLDNINFSKNFVKFIKDNKKIELFKKNLKKIKISNKEIKNILNIN